MRAREVMRPLLDGSFRSELVLLQAPALFRDLTKERTDNLRRQLIAPDGSPTIEVPGWVDPDPPEGDQPHLKIDNLRRASILEALGMEIPGEHAGDALPYLAGGN